MYLFMEQFYNPEYIDQFYHILRTSESYRFKYKKLISTVVQNSVFAKLGTKLWG